MDKQREDELLMHIAAGLDPVTALAALPREENIVQDESRNTPQSTARNAWRHGVLWAVAAFVGMLLVRWLF